MALGSAWRPRDQLVGLPGHRSLPRTRESHDGMDWDDDFRGLATARRDERRWPEGFENNPQNKSTNKCDDVPGLRYLPSVGECTRRRTAGEISVGWPPPTHRFAPRRARPARSPARHRQPGARSNPSAEPPRRHGVRSARHRRRRRTAVPWWRAPHSLRATAGPPPAAASHRPLSRACGPCRRRACRNHNQRHTGSTRPRSQPRRGFCATTDLSPPRGGEGQRTPLNRTPA